MADPNGDSTTRPRHTAPNAYAPMSKNLRMAALWARYTLGRMYGCMKAVAQNMPLSGKSGSNGTRAAPFSEQIYCYPRRMGRASHVCQYIACGLRKVIGDTSVPYDVKTGTAAFMVTEVAMIMYHRFVSLLLSVQPSSPADIVDLLEKLESERLQVYHGIFRDQEETPRLAKVTSTDPPSDLRVDGETIDKAYEIG
ncbi:hypothetical protein OPQ81_008111 [Rhizoctonia solani]|nr:hypothetical protein OPQ81_008111 [Rhizoctonia solani]